MERRKFLKGAATATWAGTIGVATARADKPQGQSANASAQPGASGKLPRATTTGTLRGEMLYRKLGSTGVEVSAIELGGWHIGSKPLSDGEAVRLIHQALDRGMNFLDNCWDYHDGRSEQLVGKALSQDGPRRWRWMDSTSCSRPRRTSTPPPGTPTGWATTRRAPRGWPRRRGSGSANAQASGRARRPA